MSGVVRIKSKGWNHLTKLAVDCSVKLQRPVNQSVVLNAILYDSMGDMGKNAVLEMVKRYLELDK